MFSEIFVIPPTHVICRFPNFCDWDAKPTGILLQIKEKDIPKPSED